MKQTHMAGHILPAVAEGILSAIQAAEALTHAGVALYDVSLFMQKAGLCDLLPAALFHHRSPYCQCIRNLPGGRIQCINCDKNQLLPRIHAVSAPFLHRCHAGMTEMIIPLRVRDRLLAVAYLGQTRSPRDALPPDMPHLPLPASHQLAHLYQNVPVADDQLLRHGARLLEMALRDCFRQIPDTLLQALYAENDSLSARVDAILMANPERSLRVRDIADDLHISPARLSQAYKKETGASIRSVMDGISLQLAQRFLKEGQSIQTIAANFGFADESEFLAWFRRHSNQSPAAFMPAADAPAHRQYVSRLQSCLQSRFRETLRVEQLAAEMKISPDHLCRLFKKATGQTITQALWSLRLSAARQALSESRMPLREIARQNGFPSESDLIRRFTQTFGISPAEYRNSR